MANNVDDYLVPVKNKQRMQQSTMSENTHHLDNNGVFEFNYSHDTCPPCQDRLIVESNLEGCEARIFCECCDFGCPECQCRWYEVEELVRTDVCNHCGRNDRQRKSSALCPFNAGKVHSSTGMRIITGDQLPTVDIVLANTQENVTCASSVASVALQDHANQANQLLVSN